jgi:hypothetical protein
MTTCDRVAESGSRRHARRAALAGVYVIVCGVMVAPICNLPHLATASHGGDSRLIIWTLAWDNHVWLDRLPSLFDANIFYPARNTLAYSEHLLGISFFTLPVYALTRNPVLAYNLVWLLSFLLSAFAAHALAWRLTRDHLAATMAGLAFAFCFYRMHQGHGHLHVIWAFWIPISLMVLERWVAEVSWRWLGLFVVIATLQALSSWYQAVLIFVASAIFMLWLVLAERAVPRTRWMRLALQAAVGAMVAIAIVAPFARHYRVLAAATPNEAAQGAADLASYLVPPENTFAGQRLLEHGVKGPRWIWGEQTLYLGWAALLLAVVGVAASLRPADPAARRLRFFVVLAIVAIALAAGPLPSEVAANVWGWSPFGILVRIPGVNLFRAPARFTVLTTLAIAVLAAAGCATLHARFGRLGRLLTIAAMLVFLGESRVVNFPGGGQPVVLIPDIYKRLASLPPGAVVSLPDYAGTPVAFDEANYELFSTAHWYPIANGFSRAEPRGFRALMDRLQTFPAPTSLEAMRETGIRYVVVHAVADPYQGGLPRPDDGVRLVARVGNDYLFEVSPRR